MFYKLLRKIKSAGIRLKRFAISARFGASPDSIYSDSFFDGPGFRKTEVTAELISEYLHRRFNPATVLDLGCGMGNYLLCFAKKGCVTLGVEGSHAGVKRIPEMTLGIQYDLRKPLVVNRSFDLVMSIEVAEHLPKKFSRNLVFSLCSNASDVIVFTAAPPGTPGDDHINCQEHCFWDNLFKKMGFSYDESETEELREFAKRNNTARWFQDWSFIYRKNKTPV